MRLHLRAVPLQPPAEVRVTLKDLFENINMLSANLWFAVRQRPVHVGLVDRAGTLEGLGRPLVVDE